MSYVHEFYIEALEWPRHTGDEAPGSNQGVVCASHRSARLSMISVKSHHRARRTPANMNIFIALFIFSLLEMSCNGCASKSSTPPALPPPTATAQPSPASPTTPAVTAPGQQKHTCWSGDFNYYRIFISSTNPTSFYRSGVMVPFQGFPKWRNVMNPNSQESKVLDYQEAINFMKGSLCWNYKVFLSLPCFVIKKFCHTKWNKSFPFYFCAPSLLSKELQ